MYKQFKSSCFMGNIPNNSPSTTSSIFLSEKVLASPSSMDCNILSARVSRPTLDFPDTRQMVTSSSSRKEAEDDELHQEEDNEKIFETHQERYEVLLSSLKVKLPNVVNKLNLEEEDEEEQGCKTPTSPEYKIPMACPPAPRKPKPMPAKRKDCHKRVFLDLSNETESLFPPALLADLGKKIKKIRTANPIF